MGPTALERGFLIIADKLILAGIFS